MLRRKDRTEAAFDLANIILCTLIMLVTLYPFWYVLVLSLNDGSDSMRGGIYFWPRSFTVSNYLRFLCDPKLLNGLKISILRTAVGTVSGVFFTALVAYGLSFKELVLKKFYYTVILVAMYFSGGLIPFFVLLRQLHLYNSFWVYILPNLLNVFLIFIFLAFFREIPESMAESARMDGAREFRIFISIILPSSLPAFATAALFFAVGQWNSWIDAAYFVNKPELRPLMYLMMQIINKSMTLALSGGSGRVDVNSIARSTTITSRSLQMAAVIISIVPILFVYPFLQKYFVKGIIIGAVKE